MTLGSTAPSSPHEIESLSDYLERAEDLGIMDHPWFRVDEADVRSSRRLFQVSALTLPGVWAALDALTREFMPAFILLSVDGTRGVPEFTAGMSTICNAVDRETNQETMVCVWTLTCGD